MAVPRTTDFWRIFEVKYGSVSSESVSTAFEAPVDAGDTFHQTQTPAKSNSGILKPNPDCQIAAAAITLAIGGSSDWPNSEQADAAPSAEPSLVGYTLAKTVYRVKHWQPA